MSEAEALDAPAFARLFAPLARDLSPLLLAVSGGPDSTALMHAAAAWARSSAAPPLRVATVDHGLRDGSREEAEEVGAAAARLALPHAVLRWTGGRRCPPSQQAARAARYRLLVAHARDVGAGRIATAHTLDDQAETILMRIADGSGVSGLAGMAPEVERDGVRIVRPFLPVPKAALIATCRASGWSFVDDPANSDRRYARARWRALAPALAAEGLDASRLARLAERARRVDEALAAVSARVAETALRPAPGGVELSFRALATEPDEISLRVLARAVTETPVIGNPGRLSLERLEAAFLALRAARAAAEPLRRTLAGRLLSLDRRGVLALTPEPPRSRGRAKHPEVARTPPSLGRGDRRA